MTPNISPKLHISVRSDRMNASMTSIAVPIPNRVKMVRNLARSLLLTVSGIIEDILLNPAFPSAINTFTISPTQAIGRIMNSIMTILARLMISICDISFSLISSICLPIKAIFPYFALKTNIIDITIVPNRTKKNSVSCFLRHIMSLMISPFICSPPGA